MGGDRPLPGKCPNCWRIGRERIGCSCLGEDSAFPGPPCDHDKMCCSEHGHHVTPHRGCVLR